TQVKSLAGLERLERDALEEHVLRQRAARQAEQIQLGLIHQEHLSAMPGAPFRVSIPDESTLGLGDGGLDGAHRLAGRPGEAERLDHAGGHCFEASNGTTEVTVSE